MPGVVTYNLPEKAVKNKAWRIKANCPTSWDEYEGNCYLFVKDVEIPMDSAERYCKGYGGHLASVLSMEENSHLGDKVGYSDSYWIGRVYF